MRGFGAVLLRRGSVVCVSSILALTGLALVPSFASAAPVGALSQLSGTAGCINNSAADGCATGGPIGSPERMAISPDGKNAYVASSGNGVILIYSRDPATGALTPLAGTDGCIAYQALSGCAVGRGIGSEPEGVTVSPDGKNVYVAGEDSTRAIAIFNRDPATGKLSQPSGPAACFYETGSTNTDSCTSGHGLGSMDTIIVSPDGRSVYTAGDSSGSGVAVLSRDPATGQLTQDSGPAGCVAESPSDGCATGHGLTGADGVAISPDGKTVYTASQSTNGGLATFSRNTTSGVLTETGCINETASDTCGQGRGLSSAEGVSVSPDGKNVYTAADAAGATATGGIAAFSRDTSTGAVTQLAGTAGCLNQNATDGCGTARGSDGVQSVEIAPDGQSAYAAGTTSNALVVLSRDSVTGALSQLAVTDGCVQENAGAATDGCATGRELTSAGYATISPDGENVYVASDQGQASTPDGGIAIFERNDPPPSCSNVAKTVPPNQASTVTLKCTDPSGNKLTLSIVSGPAHGTLGPIDQSTGNISYKPNPGYSGSDSFTYKAVDDESSNVATVSLTVTAPPVVAAAPATHCVVPSLKGKTLAQAKKLLAKSHCSLAKAKVSAAARRRGKLRVAKSSYKAGTVLPAGAGVSVRLESTAKAAQPKPVARPKPRFTG